MAEPIHIGPGVADDRLPCLCDRRPVPQGATLVIGAAAGQLLAAVNGLEPVLRHAGDDGRLSAAFRDALAPHATRLHGELVRAGFTLSPLGIGR